MFRIFRKQAPPPEIFGNSIGLAMVTGLEHDSRRLYSTLDEKRTDWEDFESLIPSLGIETEITDFKEFFVEELAFGLNCLDRVLNAKFGVEQKGPILERTADCLEAQLANKCEDFDPNKFRRFIAKRQGFYGVLNFPKKNGPVKRTLFWEYGKYLSLRCSVYDPLAITLVSARGMAIFEFLHNVVSAPKF